MRATTLRGMYKLFLVWYYSMIICERLSLMNCRGRVGRRLQGNCHRDRVVMSKSGSVRFTRNIFWTLNWTLSSVQPLCPNSGPDHQFWTFWFKDSPVQVWRAVNSELDRCTKLIKHRHISTSITSIYYMSIATTNRNYLSNPSKPWPSSSIINASMCWPAWWVAATCPLQYALLRIWRASNISVDNLLRHAEPVIPPLLKARSEGVAEPWIAR